MVALAVALVIEEVVGTGEVATETEEGEGEMAAHQYMAFWLHVKQWALNQRRRAWRRTSRLQLACSPSFWLTLALMRRGRGGPRGGRGRDGKDEEKWVPCTKLGRLVQQVRYSSDKQNDANCELDRPIAP